MPSSSLFRCTVFASSFLALACSSSGNSNRLEGPTDGGVDGSVDASKTPTDHGLTRSTCDADRVATDEGVLLYRTLESAGGSRSFHLLRPASAKCTSKSPLVIALHPALMTDTVKKNPGDYFARDKGFVDNASSNAYILAAPNALAADGQFQLAADGNDLTFLSDLIDALTLKEPVNPKRVYVMGFGEGGAVALRSACDFASRVAGVASIGGGLLKATKAACAPSEGVSVVLGAGTKDTVIPYNGDDNYEPFTDARDFLVQAMGCGDTTTTSTDTGANIVTYTTCKTSAQVQTVQVTNGTHDSIGDFLLPAYDTFLKKRFKS